MNNNTKRKNTKWFRILFWQQKNKRQDKWKWVKKDKIFINN